MTTRATARGERRAAVGFAIALALAAAVVAVGPSADGRSAVIRWAVAGAIFALTVLALGLLRRSEHLADSLLLIERRLAAIGDGAHEWLWTCDASGTITSSNRAVQDLLGYRVDEVVGRPVADFLEKPSGWYDGTRHLRSSAGETVLVESSVRPVLDSGGRVAGHEGAVRVSPTDRADAERLSRLRREILAVLDSEALTIVLQPIVNLSTGKVSGVEALARFDGQPVRPPDAWFRLAGEAGLAEPLELLALRAAIARLPELPERMFLSVNVSAATLLRPGFAALMTRGDVPLRRIMLEITEHESIDEYADIATVLDPLRAQGLRLAVDDAGAGFASFRHVVQLRPDQIKLDRDLVSGIDGDPARRALASAVVVFALEVGAGVIAEGVETEAELDVCQSLAIDSAQGFYIAAPASAAPEWDRRLIRRARRFPDRAVGSA
jgi:EAL domain-containing protein (putative c-di-GMP-specific phosphodiesterase class I)/PAS domain-containing protein